MVFVRGTFRIALNVHSLNTEGAVGNYNPLVKVFLVGRTSDAWDVIEANAITGNMLKHWHARHIRDLAEKHNVPLCNDCKRGVFYRTRIKMSSEEEAIKMCVLEDLHGFLSTETLVRRESLVKTSFIVPIEEKLFSTVSVTHNRVVYNEAGKIDKEGMMPFKNEYASGIYGFGISMDLAYVGVPLAKPEDAVIPKDNRVLRAKLAIMALGNILMGSLGAKQSRAFPIAKPIQALVAVSKDPIPAPVHSYYMDYMDESIKTYEGFVSNGLVKKESLKIHIYGGDVGSNKVTIVRHESIGSLINGLLKDIESWLS